VEPTPIFAALAEAELGDDASAPRRHGDHGDHGDGRPVTEILRAAREDSSARTPSRRVRTDRRRVGHVPDLLTF
jgi:hypothetical protein